MASDLSELLSQKRRLQQQLEEIEQQIAEINDAKQDRETKKICLQLNELIERYPQEKQLVYYRRVLFNLEDFKELVFERVHDKLSEFIGDSYEMAQECVDQCVNSVICNSRELIKLIQAGEEVVYWNNLDFVVTESISDGIRQHLSAGYEGFDYDDVCKFFMV